MEPWYEKIIVYHRFFIFLINKLWIEHRTGLIFLILSFLWLLCAFYYLTISAFIFNLFIIPNIEHKTGQKIGHHPIDEYIWLGNWMNRQYETASYIVYSFYIWRLRKSTVLPKYFNQFPLKKINYSVKLISKTELFFSSLLLFSMAIGAFLTVILGIGLIFFKSYITLNN